MLFWILRNFHIDKTLALSKSLNKNYIFNFWIIEVKFETNNFIKMALITYIGNILKYCIIEVIFLLNIWSFFSLEKWKIIWIKYHLSYLKYLGHVDTLCNPRVEKWYFTLFLFHFLIQVPVKGCFPGLTRGENESFASHERP